MDVAAKQTVKPLVSLAVGVSLMLACTCLWGCSNFGGTARTPTQSLSASPVQDPMLQNIPLPVGFQMVPERSVVRNDGSLRVAMCEYEGSTPPERVVAFYQNYMPSAQFSLKQSRLDNGQYKLRFESDAEECNIWVRRTRQKTTLVVDLGPLPKGSAERKAKLPVRRP